MTLKKRLFSSMFLRNMLADFGTRSACSTSNNNFIPYFQYKIGAYQPDHYLYFPKEPFAFIEGYSNAVEKLFHTGGQKISNKNAFDTKSALHRQH